MLAAAERMINKEIASTVDCSRPTVRLWRRRFARMGMAGLADAPRSGRPRQAQPGKIAGIVAHTMKTPYPRTHRRLFHGFNSFFVAPDAPSHGKPNPRAPAPPSCPPAAAATSGRTLPAAGSS
ncbi:TPA: hypothetical protein DCY65_00880 [Candidatus Acetothermia bacterium]|nr:hypothetical protein [Candidatus Acetothermia bacterium]